MAVEGAEGHVLSPAQGEEDLRKHPLPVHITAGLGEPLRCAEGRGEKEVVHMKKITVALSIEIFPECCFSASPPSINSDQNRTIRFLYSSRIRSIASAAG